MGGRISPKSPRAAAFHTLPVFLSRVSDCLDTNPETSLAASGALPPRSGWGPKSGMETPLGSGKRGSMFLAMHQRRPRLGEGIITRQQAALHPSLLSPSSVPQLAERAQEMRGQRGGSQFPHTMAYSGPASGGCLLRDLLGTCPLGKMATTDGGFTYSREINA